MARARAPYARTFNLLTGKAVAGPAKSSKPATSKGSGSRFAKKPKGSPKPGPTPTGAKPDRSTAMGAFRNPGKPTK